MRMSTLDRAKRSRSSASAPNRATNTPCLIGTEMFISATFPGDTVGLPKRLMTGFASSPSSKPLRPAGFFAGAQHSWARESSFSMMAVSEYRGRRHSELRAANSRHTIKNERFSRHRGLPVGKQLRPQFRMAGHHFRRIGGLGAEFLGRMPGPARIVHHAAGENDEIGLARSNDVFGLARACDEADRHRRQAGLLAYLRAEQHLIARRQRNLLARIEPAPGHVHEVAA